MGAICPTVLAATTDEYEDQIELVAAFASRIQIDLGDGTFTTKTIGVEALWWPSQLAADIHLMYMHPRQYLESLVTYRPHLVILHAETKDNLVEAFDYLRSRSVKTGLALLQATSVDSVAALIKQVDHVLIFSGSLGSFGGKADLSLLHKVAQVRALNPTVEIGWDGGANQENVLQLVQGGVDVVNVGGAIQKANHPENAYRDLERRLHD